MLLNGREISSRGLVRNCRQERFRASSYDVSVGQIIDAKGETHGSYKMEPQGMAIVISRERLALPTDISGYAIPKTGLCNDGVLTLSTGIIDPGYEGHVSSMLINFGSVPYFFKEGDAFLRITFHQLRSVSQTPEAPRSTDAEYLRERQKAAVALPDTFLDIPRHVGDIADKVLDRQLNKLVYILGAAGLLLVLVTFLGAPFVGNILPDRSDIREDVLSELREEDISRLDKNIVDLEQRVEELEVGKSPQDEVPAAD